MTEVRLPELSPGVMNGTVSMWHYSEGDSVKRDDDLVEIVTDKLTFNVSAPISGRVKEIIKKEGDTVDTNDLLAMIE